MLKIEILNRPPTTVSKRMESEDPDKTTYVFAWRWKPYGLAVAISAPPVAEPGGPVPWKKGGLRQYGKA